MGRLCSVCTHRKHREIDAALIEHSLPYQAIANAYGLSHTALYNHRMLHLRARLEEARMLDAQALAARMAELDGHVDRILEGAGRDKRLALMAIAEGRRNVDTLARLIVLHAAEQHDEQQRTVNAEGYPPPVMDNSPAALRRIVRGLIESGVALPSPEERAAEQEAHHQTSDDDDDRGFHTTPAV